MQVRQAETARTITHGDARDLSDDFAAFIQSDDFPCVGAKSALATAQIETIELEAISAITGDRVLHAALKRFGPEASAQAALRTFAALFSPSAPLTEHAFEQHLWARLQALHDLDVAESTAWAPDVSSDPRAPNFSMSVAGIAYYIVGLHPNASRPARRFWRPALIFNSHAQFEALKTDGRYSTMQKIIRARDRDNAGSINPMLSDFGTRSEARQYSGRAVGDDWQCPLRVRS
jgi:uncharacterized protein